MRRLLCSVTLLGLTLACPSLAQGQQQTPDGVRRGEGRYPFEESVLDNGLRVISLEDHSTPIVAVQLWYHVGSKDEQPDRQGFAHMFEHMMFRGTDRLGPTDHFDFVSGTGGSCNAYTSFDQTVYVQELPSNQLDMVLWLEAERMAGLTIDDGGFATERKVVEEERRMGLNQPYGMVLEQALDHLFTVHPYRWSPIGKIEHLRASTAQDIQSFWDTYYVPNNATLVVVGDVTHARVRELAAKNFGWIPRCADPPRVTALEPVGTGLRRLDIEEQNGPAPIAALIFQGVPQGHPDAVALEMLMSILGGGESSRAYIELVRRKEVAALAASASVGFEQAGLAVIGGVAMPVVGDVDAIIDACWEQVEALKAEGVTAAELARVRNTMLRDDVTGSLTVASKASALGTAAVLLGDTQKANTRLADMARVDADDLQRVANTYLVKARCTELRVEPTIAGMFSSLLSMAANTSDQDEQPDEDEADVESGARAVASGPKAAAERPERLPDAPPKAPPLAVTIELPHQQTVLDNGLTVVVVENHEVPFVSASLRLDAGAWSDAEGAPGSAAMACSMVTRGTLVRDAEALAAELEKHAISLGADAGHDSASVNVSAITEQFERALRLLAEVVMLPRFDAKEFRTLRDQTATGMAITEKTPAVMADRALDKALWGNHPYGRPAEGTSDDLAALTAEGLADWWASHVRPETATLYLAGDVTPERAFEVAAATFEDWEAEGEASDRPLPSWEQPEGLTIRLVDRRGAVQSEIRAGHGGVTRRHPFHAPVAVLSRIFGGSFNSRLNASLRVDKGLTYGARGGFSSRRFGGQFSASTFTKTPKTAETVRALLDEVAAMASVPPSADEIDGATSYLAGSFAGSLETPQAVAGRLWTLRLNDLPDDYWSTWLGSVAGMTAAQVSEAGAALLHPEDLMIVVVGDASQIQDELEQIAEVELVTSDG